MDATNLRGYRRHARPMAAVAYAALWATAAAAGPTPPRPGLSLTFADEFDGDRLGPEWSTCFATGTCLHPPELQRYLPAGDPAGTVTVGDGRLTLTARPGGTPPEGRPEIRYLSGMVSTHGHVSMRQGYAEARIRIPAGRGVWPAFWLFQDPGTPGYAEIDVMESLGHEPGKVYATLHAGPDWARRQILQVEPVSTDFGAGSFADGFHVYAVDWGPDRTRFLIDGRETGSFPTPAAIDVPMHLMLNLAVGGEWAGPPNEPLTFPARMEIDWVRVWTNDPSAPPAGGTGGETPEPPAAAAQPDPVP